MFSRLQRLTLSAAILAIAGLSLAACSGGTPDEAEPTPTEDPTVFRAVSNWQNDAEDDLYALFGPSGEVPKTSDLSANVAMVGLCLGVVAIEDERPITVVWPSGSTALSSKLAIEFPGNFWNPGRQEWIAGLVRVQAGDEIYMTGEYRTDANWFGQIPEGCPVSEEGVFVVSAANHPRVDPPEPEEDEDNSEQQGENPSD